MNNTPTPRTDAIPWIPNCNFKHSEENLYRFVRKKEVEDMERELTAAREECAKWRQSFEGHVYVKNEEYAELCEKSRQRDRLAAREEIENLCHEYHGTKAMADGFKDMIKSITEQRDRLAEALRQIAEDEGSPIYRAKQALQSLNTD